MKMEIYELLYFLLPQNTFIEAQQGGGLIIFWSLKSNQQV